MQPAIIEDSISVAANTVVDNIIVSNASLRGLLQCPFPARGYFFAVNSAAGLRVDLDIGSKNVVAGADLRAGTTIENPFDLLNDGFYVEEGAQLTLRVSNSTGGALTLRYRLILEPLVDESNWAPGSPFDLSPYPDKRVMARSGSIAAGVVDSQLLDGLKYERVPVDAILTVAMTQSAIGLLRQLYVDQDRIAPPSSFPISNRLPIEPQDTTIDGVEVPANSLLQLQVSNPTGGALTVNFRVTLQELVRR